MHVYMYTASMVELTCTDETGISKLGRCQHVDHPTVEELFERSLHTCLESSIEDGWSAGG
jgi:hypothetical protein